MYILYNVLDDNRITKGSIQKLNLGVEKNITYTKDINITGIINKLKIFFLSDVSCSSLNEIINPKIARINRGNLNPIIILENIPRIPSASLGHGPQSSQKELNLKIKKSIGSENIKYR